MKKRVVLLLELLLLVEHHAFSLAWISSSRAAGPCSPSSSVVRRVVSRTHRVTPPFFVGADGRLREQRGGVASAARRKLTSAAASSSSDEVPSASENDAEETVAAAAAAAAGTQEDQTEVFSDEEMELIEGVYADPSNIEKALAEALPNMSPKLIMKLRRSENREEAESIRRVAAELNKLLDSRLEQAANTLKELLNAGEIRKLDSLIGKAGRENRLDVAFFNVLTMNIQDAATKEATASSASGESDASGEGEEGQEPAASRLQILQHIYTRCQEEVEKALPPGTALLNKLLRTEQPAIRANLYKHYLTPSPTVIKSPDGKEVELKGNAAQPVLVKVEDFVEAISNAVQQIRTVEKSGATDRESAAIMVESCRQVAKEARSVVGESYGIESKELSTLEDGLQPVFRPESADSPYIQGQT